MNSLANDKKKFYIHTLGCKVNQYESQAMRELLLKAGFDESGTKNSADVYIVNTCTVTAEADRESKYLMGHFYKTNPDAMIVATGCLAEKNAAEITAMPCTARVIKNADKGRIVDLLRGGADKGTGYEQKELVITDFKGHSKAYVKIQDGCENRCAYCKVPLVRGDLKSKPIDHIVEEVRRLVVNGFNEIILTGICLGAWGKDLGLGQIARSAGLGEVGLVDVLKALEKIEGDFRIRLSSIEPKYATDVLIGFMAQSKKICKHLHIPFQAGDDEILRLMNRPYTASEYKLIVAMARSEMPDIAITTDILVGFPGETAAHFRNTLAFMKSVAPSRAHIFTFSKREGTPAFDMDYAINRDELKSRYREMCLAAEESADLYRRSFLGKTLNVLVETKRDKETNLLKGYSDNYIQIYFAGQDDLARRVVPVAVIGFDGEKTMGVYG